VRQGTKKQRLVDPLADHLIEVFDQCIDGPLRLRQSTRLATFVHGLVHGIAHGDDQAWCSLRSAAA
jgi:hypothetical protein